MIDYPLPAKPHPKMYLMHRFRARKPHNVVAEYIKAHTREGDIVLDPYCGSGVSVIEAVASKRRAIGVDLNPLAIFITRMTLTYVDIKRLKNEFENLKKRLHEDEYILTLDNGKEKKITIFSLFETRCPKCEGKASIETVVETFLVRCPECKKEINVAKCEKGKIQGEYKCYLCGKKFNLNRADTKGTSIVNIRYKCPSCNVKGWKTPDKFDIILWETCERARSWRESGKRGKTLWYPDYRLYYPNGMPFMTKRRIDTIPDLFGKRNLIALSIIWHEINKVEDDVLRDMFKLAFSASLEFVCRLNPLRPSKKQGEYSTKSGWTVHEYWTPAIHALNNPIYIFYDRVESIIKGKEESNKRLGKVRFARNISDLLSGKADVLLVEDSAIRLDEILNGEEEIIDYIFTDPPYGGALQYYELDFLRNAWLFPNKLNWHEDEIVINDKQGKSLEQYYLNLRRSFQEMYKALKKGGYMTVTFHHSLIEVYNTVIKAATAAGFDLEKIIFQPPAVRSAKQSLHPFTSAVGDYYMRFSKGIQYKPLEKKSGDESFEKVAVRNIIEIIAERGEPTSYTTILKEIYPRLRKEGYLLQASHESIRKILEKYEGEFVFIEGKGWWFRNPGKYKLHIPLKDRLEVAVTDILKRKIEVEFDDVLRTIYQNFPNALTPDKRDVREILETYAQKSKGGKWILRETEKKLFTEHTAILSILANIGRRLKFDIWIGEREQGERIGDKSLSSYVSASLREEFKLKDIQQDLLEIIKNIDIIWVREGKIRYAFEVEYTTAITEAVRRLKSIPYDAKKVIVIPSRRKNLLNKKIKELLLSEMISKEDLEKINFTYFDEVKSIRTTKRAEDLDTILRPLIIFINSRGEEQEKLDIYLN